MGFLGGRIGHRRGAVLAAVDADPDTAKSLFPGGHVDIVSNAIQSESLSARPSWICINHFRLGDRKCLRRV